MRKTLILTASIVLLGAVILCGFLYVNHIRNSSNVNLTTEKSSIPSVEMKEVKATEESLTFSFLISGLNQVKTIEDFDNLICDPYLQLDEPIVNQLVYHEAEIQNEPLFVIYSYDISAEKGERISGKIDLTIGPCGNYGFNESNVTAVPPSNLIGNYIMDFDVQVD